MLMLIDIHTKVLETHLEVRSLTFECQDRQSRYWGKNIVVARWSIEHDRTDNHATNPCWEEFAQVLLEN